MNNTEDTPVASGQPAEQMAASATSTPATPPQSPQAQSQTPPTQTQETTPLPAPHNFTPQTSSNTTFSPLTQATTPLPRPQDPQPQAPSYVSGYTSSYPQQPQSYWQASYPYSPTQSNPQAQNYTPHNNPYPYGSVYQPWQTPTAAHQKSTWTTATLAIVATIALVIGIIVGAGAVSAFSDDTSQSTPGYGTQPDYGNGVFGQDGSDPFFPEDVDNSSGSRVESAPGVLIIDSILTGAIGSGTGMVISADGYAVTNYHVVEGSTTVRVTIADTKETYNATVIGHDASVDIALLKLEDAKNLKHIDFDTSSPKTNTEISVVGNAGGQGYLSQLTGKITAVDQDITAMSDTSGSEDLTGLIKTDADVVQGYSGGPMFNKAGKVIGVVVAASKARGYSDDTDGYAIPAKTALSVVDQIKTGKSKGSTIVGANAALGVTVESADSTSQTKGAKIVEVNSGSAAEKAGIKAGDVITSVNNKSISSASDLSKMIKTFSVGDTVKITYTNSSGEKETVEATLGESPVN
ncbi:MAG: trypsin-like peptidase domain-containing protein [Actinomycetaceae bacterium]|nr:trypsin-like peptidase domain-containing protein [Actinomycetaceae bacterium]